MYLAQWCRLVSATLDEGLCISSTCFKLVVEMSDTVVLTQSLKYSRSNVNSTVLTMPYKKMTGLNKPLSLSKDLADVLGTKKGEKMSRPQVGQLLDNQKMAFLKEVYLFTVTEHFPSPVRLINVI